ncbi:MAG: hypothetical protein HFG88_08370 [Dorea sp.]|nr:hypothetical protein [Dorea sp.]
MENRYEVSIPISEYVNDAASPSVYFDTYEEATLYAKPLVDQGYYAVIAMENIEEEDEATAESIEIPLDVYQYIKNLTDEQAGVVFKNIYAYFFDGSDIECEDNDIVQVVTLQTIKRIKEYAQDGK